MEQGDYETALSYLKQSLAIQQKIGDKAGLCLALFNMGHVHAQNNKMQEAVNIWVASYIIAKQINLAQALQELADLAPQLGLPDGLESWEMLAQKMQNKKDQ
jgi:tetratricopeptide (TPR) repeat protein